MPIEKLREEFLKWSDNKIRPDNSYADWWIKKILEREKELFRKIEDSKFKLSIGGRNILNTPEKERKELDSMAVFYNDGIDNLLSDLKAQSLLDIDEVTK